MTRVPALGRRGEGWVAGQAVLIAAVLAAPLAARAWLGAWAAVIGAALIALGFAVLAWAGTALGSALTPFPAPRAGAAIADRGPYAYVRHPMYSAGVLVALGWSILFASWVGLVLTAALAALFELKSRREEAWLAARPGYDAYRARVRGRLVPRSAGRRSRS